MRTTAPTLLGQVRRNEIAALDVYQGQTIVVRGVVDSTGLRDFKRTTIKPGMRVMGVPVADPEARTRTVQRPFVALSGEREHGHVVCFFKNENRVDAARVSKGDDVLLEGTVVRLGSKHNRSLVFLDDCFLMRGGR